MGWYQDKFPGSPAARQRIFFTRALIVYSVAVGTVCYFFSPLAKRISKHLEEYGPGPLDTGFFKHIRDTAETRVVGARKVPSVAEFMEARQEEESRRTSDFFRPDASPDTIRAAVSFKQQ